MALNLLIRDGLERDVAACLAMDSHYETDYVWQMNVHQEPDYYQVTFKTERLPREMESLFPLSEDRLRRALPRNQCFLVATAADEPTMLGFLTMWQDSAQKIAWIQHIVVAPEFRRRRIGSRLLSVARKWAMEQNLVRITVETQTKNYPCIKLCQKAGLEFCGFNDQYFQNKDIALLFSQSLR
jgi:ribosomal protein S18 acetylase RimI-like enzyme